jgi:molecular chaperone GrpE
VVRSGAHRREDEKIKSNQETQALMAQKTKIVIEEENDTPPQDNPAAPPDPASAADEPATDPDPIKDLEEKLAAAQADADENRDRMLRMAAELDNFKKRSARELDDLKKYATENLIRQLLTVVDNLERAIASASPDNENGQRVVDGVALTLTEVMKILEKHYVSPIQALGEPFDPAFHQAMSQEERVDQPPNTVVQEFQKGYLIHDRLLRPAMVVVSKAPQNGQPEEKTVDTNA